MALFSFESRLHSHLEPKKAQVHLSLTKIIRERSTSPNTIYPLYKLRIRRRYIKVQLEIGSNISQIWVPPALRTHICSIGEPTPTLCYVYSLLIGR